MRKNMKRIFLGLFFLIGHFFSIPPARALGNDPRASIYQFQDFSNGSDPVTHTFYLTGDQSFLVDKSCYDKEGTERKILSALGLPEGFEPELLKLYSSRCPETFPGEPVKKECEVAYKIENKTLTPPTFLCGKDDKDKTILFHQVKPNEPENYGTYFLIFKGPLGKKAFEVGCTGILDALGKDYHSPDLTGQDVKLVASEGTFELKCRKGFDPSTPIFLQACKNSQNDPAIEHTLTKLKNLGNGNSCETYFEALKQLPAIDLSISGGNGGSSETIDIRLLNDFRQLKKINLSGNKVKYIEDLKYLDKLEELSLSALKLPTLPLPLNFLSRMKNLRKLDLSHNILAMDELSALKSLANLNALELANTHFSNTQALTTLQSLLSLDLSNNQIVDIDPLIKLKRLQDINLQNNQIVDFSALAYIKDYQWSQDDMLGNTGADTKARLILRNPQRNIPDNSGDISDPTLEEAKRMIGRSARWSETGLCQKEVTGICSLLLRPEGDGKQIKTMGAGSQNAKRIRIKVREMAESGSNKMVILDYGPVEGFLKNPIIIDQYLAFGLRKFGFQSPSLMVEGLIDDNGNWRPVLANALELPKLPADWRARLPSFTNLCQKALGQEGTILLQTLKTLSQRLELPDLNQPEDCEMAASILQSKKLVNFSQPVEKDTYLDLRAIIAAGGPTQLLLSKTMMSDLFLLSLIPGLEGIDLSYNKINSGEGFKSIKSLKWLNLSGNKLHLNSLAWVKELAGLQALSLAYNRLTEENIRPLADIPTLVSLNLLRNHIGRAGFLSNLQSLEELNLSWNHLFDQADIDQLGTLSSLEDLDLRGNAQIQCPSSLGTRCQEGPQ